MKKIFFCLVLLCLAITSAFGQIAQGTFSGTVADATGAVLPGVSITVTNTATGVMTTAVSNEAGAYFIPSLIAGPYNVSAELPGFQKSTYSNATLEAGVTLRLNFALKVSSQATSVEVTVAADTVLSTSSPTVGQGLTERKVVDLPLTGGNVLDLVQVLGGVDNVVATGNGEAGQSAFGREAETLAGISAQDTPVLRDGIMVNDLRYPTGINANTVINPDMVGEVRLIVTPVDAELGRGNGVVQITTRSGTNQFRGAAVWNVQNTALNPNSWANNQHQPNRIIPFWSNNNQTTFSAGGPIIKNKTFFFGLFDLNINWNRASNPIPVLTPCAKNGVFRYFDGWNNGTVGTATNGGGATPSRQTVDNFGNPLTPTTNPNGTPYTGKLEYASVYGPVTFPGGVPNADCSNGAVNGSWDTFRTKQDPTGFVSRTMALMPAPNDFSNIVGTVDGLNTASYDVVRHFRGVDNLFSVGEATGTRHDYNVKIDHNFNQKHRGNFAWSYERVVSDDTLAGLPGTWSNTNFHRPTTMTGGLVSTLTASMVNEVKAGYRVSGTNVLAPWDNPANAAGIKAYLPPAVNGFEILTDVTGGVGVCNPITGARPTPPPGACLGTAAGGANLTATAVDRTPLYTYGDTMSWTKGKHSVRFGGELRMASSRSQGSSAGLGFFQNAKDPVVVVAGATPGSPLAITGTTAIANTNPALSGIGTNDAAKARNLLNFLSGSLSSVNNQYFMNKPTDTAFSDFTTSPLITNTIKQREFDLFVKDDFKIRPTLTLNVGLRYEWYGVPYSEDGFTAAAIGSGNPAFGLSGSDFTGWMNPGIRGSLTSLHFVGPGSPNPGSKLYNNDNKNFGPAVGFAWNPRFLGENKTTIRGGYQITYQGGGRYSTIEGPIDSPPGRVYSGTATQTLAGDQYLDLTKLNQPGVVPPPATISPLAAIPVTDRSQTISFFDPNFTSPYVQNLTLAVTRSINQHMTIDVRYVGTLARKLYNGAGINLNSPNFLYNGLLPEFNSIRAGGESPLLNSLLNGVNICTTGCTGTFGAIGTTVNGVPQTAAMQMRASSTFSTNLAAGNYGGAGGVASALATLDYIQSGCPAAGAAGNCGLPAISTSTIRGAALRAGGVAPENFIYTNPQFATVNYLSNMGSANYHSVQVEYTLRPTNGVTTTINYTFSKDLGLLSTFTNPVNRHMDYTIVNANHPDILRANGTIELPFGPGKTLFSGTNGVLARAIENWKAGYIWTASSGAWTNISAQSNMYANGVPDVVNAAGLKELLNTTGLRWTQKAGSLVQGSFFDPAEWTKVPDPQCANVTSLQNLNGLNPGAVNRCTLTALAKVVTAGTPGSIPLTDGSGNAGLIVLQNPQPGTQGNLGQNVLRGLAPWRLDMNLSKAFRITEDVRAQFRADAVNVLNHPQPNAPSLTINTPTTLWGSTTSKTGGRTFQAQLRIDF
ncbi:MAG TPA: TonB-dependent receptor [Terriglobia bacterium]|jgi:hypothetical protein